jgi:hypothetical protein
LPLHDWIPAPDQVRGRLFAGMTRKIEPPKNTAIYWYLGGREAWEVAGKPKAEVRPADW